MDSMPKTFLVKRKNLEGEIVFDSKVSSVIDFNVTSADQVTYDNVTEYTYSKLHAFYYVYICTNVLICMNSSCIIGAGMWFSCYIYLARKTLPWEKEE